MNVLICGSRDWTDGERIHAILAAMIADGKETGVFPELVIHGGARGADTLAGVAAKGLGIPVRTFTADWKAYGRVAGPIRNTRMLVDGRPDLVLAFHHDIEHSKGTKDMVRQARAAGVHVTVFSS